jgi:hypothetical protein
MKESQPDPEPELQPEPAGSESEQNIEQFPQPGFRRAPLGIPIEISQEFSTCAKGNKPMYLSERKPYIDPGCELYFDV